MVNVCIFVEYTRVRKILLKKWIGYSNFGKIAEGVMIFWDICSTLYAAPANAFYRFTSFVLSTENNNERELTNVFGLSAKLSSTVVVSVVWPESVEIDSFPPRGVITCHQHVLGDPYSRSPTTKEKGGHVQPLTRRLHSYW